MSDDLTLVQSSGQPGSFQPGQKVFQRYELKHIAGRGGMGVVWLAEDTQLDQLVALKILPDQILHDAEAINDLKRETKRCLKLNHHHIVRIYDFIQDPTGAAISMEYVDGDTLSVLKLRGKHRCLEPGDIQPWLGGLCDALHYAHHTAKVIHRDLKPSNVMVTRDGTVKITDFGIATSISDSMSRVSLRHTTSGTLTYMSPQQARGLRPSPSDDIYALGALLYDLLTGKPPFYTGNIQHQLESVSPPSLTERRKELETSPQPLPAVWEKTILACLAKEPEARPASMAEVATALGLTIKSVPDDATVRDVALLDATLKEGPPSPPTTLTASTVFTQATVPPPPSGPTRPPFRWMPWAAGLAGLLILVGLISATIYHFSGHGTLVVNSDPPGARVTLGAITGVTPFAQEKISRGSHAVQVSLPGFDSVEKKASIQRDQVTDLGLVTLERSTGILEVASFPAGATFALKLKKSEVPGRPESFAQTLTSPALQASIPTGLYSLTASLRGYPTETRDIEISASTTYRWEKDFILDRARAGLPPVLQDILTRAVEESFTGFSPEDKGKAATALEKLGREYLNANAFQQAAELAAPLGRAGGDAIGYQKSVDERQASWLAEQDKLLGKALAQEDFATARQIVDSLKNLTDLTGAAPLKARYQDAWTAFQQVMVAKKAEAESLMASGKNEEAANLLAKLEIKAPSDPDLALLATQADLALPAKMSRITDRVGRLEAVLKAPDLKADLRVTLESHLSLFRKAGERQRSLINQIASLESEIKRLRSRIPGLQQALKANRDKQTGYAILGLAGLGAGIGGAASGSGVAAGAGGGAAVVGASGAAARGRDIDAINAELASIDQQISSKNAQIAKLRADLQRIQSLPLAKGED